MEGKSSTQLGRINAGKFTCKTPITDELDTWTLRHYQMVECERLGFQERAFFDRWTRRPSLQVSDHRIQPWRPSGLRRGEDAPAGFPILGRGQGTRQPEKGRMLLIGC